MSLDESTSLLTASSVDASTVNEDQEDNKNLEARYHDYNMALHKGPILVSLWMGSFLSALDGTVVANIMNSVAEEFHESDKKQWIATSYLLTNTAFQPLYGKLSDITGRKFAILTSHFFFGIGVFLTCFAQNVNQFAIARAICGIGGGGINAMSSITVSDICTTRERGTFQGYANIVFGTGQLLGGPIGGFLLDTIGWRAAFGVQVPLLLVCSTLAFQFVNIKLVHVPARNERFTWKNLSRIDIGGSLSLVVTISSILFLTSSNLNKLILSVVTLVAFSLFIYIELYVAKERILPFELLKGTFGLSSIATLISSFIVYGDIFRSPIYLQLIQNISVTMSGLYLIFPSIATALGSVFTGWVLRNTKLDLSHCSSALIFSGISLQFLGLLMAYYLVSHLSPAMPPIQDTLSMFVSVETIQFASTSNWWKFFFIATLCISSWGYAILLVATLVSIVFSIEKSQQGTITGIFYLWRSIGNVLGASLTLVVFEKSLKSILYQYMFEQNRDRKAFKFTRKQYQRMITDSSYMRTGPFPRNVLQELLNVYNKAFLVSYFPNIALALLGVATAWILYKVQTRKVTMNSV